VRQFKNRTFASENPRRIPLIHNNLLSIFVIERANGLAIPMIVQDWTIFSLIGLTHYFTSAFCSPHSRLPEMASRVTVMGQFSQPAGFTWETQ